MILHNGNIALEWQDLLKGGINEDTIKKASYRGSNSWPFFRDPSLNNRLLILWSDIKESYRAMIQNNIGNPYEVIAAEVITPYIVVKQSDRYFIQRYTHEDGKSLTPEQQQKYIAALGYLNLLDTCTKKTYKAMGFPSREEFMASLFSLIKANNISLPPSRSGLLERLKCYREQGPLAVIDGRIGNQNTRVLNTEQQQWLMSAYADHRKPTVEMVYNVYLRQCKEAGWKAASASTVKAFLADKKTRHIVEIERDQEIWKNKFGITITTEKPVNPSALWESDGTKLNLFYRDNTGKIKADLYMYVVVDVASEVFLGYNFGYTENGKMIIGAWRMAIQRTGLRPRQTRYDGGGPHKSAVVNSFMDNVTDAHIISKAYNGQSKYIEGILGRFQTQHLRLFHNFTGMNVDTKKDDSRLNESFVKSNKHLVPGKEECIRQAVEAFEAWNYSKNRKGNVRMELFNNATMQVGHALTDMDKVNLLYEERDAITRGKDGIKMIHEGEAYMYDVYKGQLVDMDFHIENTNRAFAIKWNPEDLSHIYLMDKETKQIVARADNKTTIAGSFYDAKKGTRTLLNANLEQKKQQVQHVSEMLSHYKMLHPVELDHSEYHKDALNRAEGDYRTQSINEAAPLTRHTPTLKQAPAKDIMLDDDFKEGGVIEEEQ